TFESVGPSPNAVEIVKSTDCGRTFGPPQLMTTFIPYDSQDQASPEPIPTQLVSDEPAGEDKAETRALSDRARGCGDFGDAGTSWTTPVKIPDVTSNPNYEQFDCRAVPFAGDYLYVSSLGSFAYGVWTDWRDTVHGMDPRESPEDEDAATADVLQCRTLNTVQTKKGSFSSWSGDLCPHAGGIDQNIYGDTAP